MQEDSCVSVCSSLIILALYFDAAVWLDKHQHFITPSTCVMVACPIIPTRGIWSCLHVNEKKMLINDVISED